MKSRVYTRDFIPRGLYFCAQVCKKKSPNVLQVCKALRVYFLNKKGRVRLWGKEKCLY